MKTHRITIRLDDKFYKSMHESFEAWKRIIKCDCSFSDFVRMLLAQNPPYTNAELHGDLGNGKRE